MKPKVLITMQGGMIQNITTDQDMDIVIVDYDLPSHGEPAFKGCYAPDYIVKGGEFAEMFQNMTGAELTPEEIEVRDELKRIHF